MTGSRIALAVLAAVLFVASSCRPEPSPPAWSSGQLLLDVLGDARIFDEQGGRLAALPLDVTGGPGELAVMVQPKQWHRVGVFREREFPGVDIPDGALIWEAAPVARLWLGGQRPSLRYAGEELKPLRVTGFSNVWRDAASGLTFWWQRNEGLLTAIGVRPAAATLLSSHAAEPPPPARDAVALGTTQLTLNSETRRALLLPVPTRLRWPSRELRAQTLELTLGVQPRLLGQDPDGRALHVVSGEAPVALTVTAITADGARHELSSHVVRQRGRFVGVRVDLRSVSGQRVALELSAEPVATLAPGVTPVLALADGLFSGAPLGSASGRGGRPHVVLIQLDTLRADRLGCYGYERDTSPGLDAWAAASAELFEDAVSDSNWTLPSTATLLTGLSTRQHGLLAFPAALDGATTTLAERLRAEGYDTFAQTEGGFVSPAFGMDRGFEVFEVQPAQASDWSASLSRLAERGDDRPVFLFLHTYRAHAPWAPDTRFADLDAPYDGPLAGLHLDDGVLGRLSNGLIPSGEAEVREVNRRYDAAVRRLDDVVSAFLAELGALVPPEDRLVIITSDHGEHLFEHGHISHGKTLFDAVLKVPLLVSWPGAQRRGRNAAPAAGVDVVPTVLDVLGLPAPEPLAGRSLVSLSAGDGDVLRVSQHASSAHAVLRDGYKLVVGRTRGEQQPPSAGGLFQRSSDPGETADVLSEQPARAAELARALDRWLQDHPPLRRHDSTAELDPELLNTLLQLGYLGDG